MTLPVEDLPVRAILVTCALLAGVAAAAPAQATKAAFQSQVTALTPHLGTGDTAGVGAIFAKLDDIMNAHVASLSATLKDVQTRYETHRTTAGANFAQAHAQSTPARDSAVKDEQARLLKEYEGVKSAKDRLATAQGVVDRMRTLRTSLKSGKDEILAKLERFAGTF